MADALGCVMRAWDVVGEKEDEVDERRLEVWSMFRGEGESGDGGIAWEEVR